MNLTDEIRSLYSYNAWANSSALKSAAQLSEDQLLRPQGHSWDSVYGILLHILNAEWIWLRRWNGESPRQFPSEGIVPTIEALEAFWQSVSAERDAFLAGLDDSRLAQDIAYTNTQGQPFQLPLWQLMYHLVNHGTHHRGELAGMYAQLGVEHTEDDLLYYLLEQTGQR